MFVSDLYLNIKNTEEYPIREGMIEKLDEMLKAQNVQHFFSLPVESTDGIADNGDHILSLHYDSRDDMIINLIYILWCKAVRNADDEKIMEAMKKIVRDSKVKA